MSVFEDKFAVLSRPMHTCTHSYRHTQSFHAGFTMPGVLLVNLEEEEDTAETAIRR